MLLINNNTKSIYYVRQIDAASANDFIRRWHYSGRVVANSKIHLAIFKENDIMFDEMIGVLQYGYPINGENTFLKYSDEINALELNRMALIDDEPRNSESRCIALCNKWLKQNTDVKWLLSFSDGKENNVGYIYQATNWLYLGYLLSDSFYEIDGDVLHAVSVWHKYKEKHHLRDSHTTNEIICKEHENVSIILSKQHVYVFPLDRKCKFNYINKPYPKLENEVPILERRWLKKNGIINNSIERYSKEVIKGI